MSSGTHFVSLKTAVGHLVSPPEDEWRRFESMFQKRVLKQGEYLIRSGERSIHLGFINAGLLRFFYQSPRGAEFNKSFAQENSFAAAYSAFLSNTETRFSIQALEESHLLVAKLSDITGLFDKHECWGKLGRLLAEQLYIRKEQREAEFLLDDAETRYRNFQKQYPGLEGRVAQYHVASYVGITPVALSRIRKKLKTDFP